MTSDRDDLEQQLRENLKLRRQLAAKVEGEGNKPAQRDRLPLGLGSLLGLSRTCRPLASRLGREVYRGLCASAIGASRFLFWLPALILYGLGRTFRYVLSGE